MTKATDSCSKIYLIMNKPCGYVCSAVSDSHKTVYELLPQELQALVRNAKRGERLHTVGRLDCNTSGLLLFTNDGYFSDRLTRPQNKIQKCYEAVLRDPVEAPAQTEYAARLAKGIILPAEKKAPEQKCEGAKLEFLDPTHCRITLTEGKFHEVRRLFRALGNEVQELRRLSLGKYSLPPDLKEGQIVPVPALY